MNDMQAVREAAERRIANEYQHSPWGPWPHRKDAETLADAYLSLADPTPLTLERLVEAGGKCVGDDAIRFGDLYFTICEVDGIIGVMVGEEHLPRKMWPRTVGELRQLLLRMEEQ